VSRAACLVSGACACAVLALQGCALRGTIIDHTRYEVNVKRLRPAQGEGIRILHGDIEGVVPLEDIESIEIDPAFARTFHRRLYYKAEISMHEGRTLRGPGRNRTGPEGTYVCVQHVLVGDGPHGEFRISLDKVSRLVIE